MTQSPQAQLVAWLTEQGYSADQIEKILGKVAQYDRDIAHQSVFDALESGEVDLTAIIRDALGE